MDDRSHLTDQDLDRLLAGRPPAHEPSAALADFIRDLRTGHVKGPGEATEARHIAAIVEQARSLENDPATVHGGSMARTGARQPSRSRRKFMHSNRFAARAAKAGAGVVSVALATTGLAFAGVLPDAASNKLGLGPNQSEGPGGAATTPSRAGAVQDVINSPQDRGCAFGHAVAKAAGGLPAHAQAQECKKKGTRGKSAGKRQDNANRPTGAGNPTGNTPAASDFGRTTSGNAQTQGRGFGEGIAGAPTKPPSPTPPPAPVSPPTPPTPAGGPPAALPVPAPSAGSETGQSYSGSAPGGERRP